jgi:hypothetical protein
VSRTLDLLRRHVGIWEGDYTHLAAADRSVLDSQLFRIRVEVFDFSPVAYRQTSHYWERDGSERELVYVGALQDDRIVFDDGRIHGMCLAIDADALYMRFGYHSDPAVAICEMFQLSADGQHRARTWHWLRAGVLERLTLVRERRTSHSPDAWPAVHERPRLGFAPPAAPASD